MTEEKIQAAMTIILHAGDARAICKEALDAVENGNFELANARLKDASKEITKAHKVQTDAIQKEAAGEEKSEYSLLFAHAQDTLMTIMSEINLAKHIIKISNALNDRLSKLEAK